MLSLLVLFGYFTLKLYFADINIVTFASILFPFPWYFFAHSIYLDVILDYFRVFPIYYIWLCFALQRNVLPLSFPDRILFCYILYSDLYTWCITLILFYVYH